MAEDSILKKTDTFFHKFTLLQFKKGEIILRADDQPVGVFYLSKGLVRQYLVSHKGEILVIHIFRPGAFFQMMWVINGTRNIYYYDAVTEAVLYRAPLKEVKEFIKKDPEILYDYTSRMLKGLDGLLQRLEHLVLDPAYVKIAALISYFARTYGEQNSDGIEIKLPVTHKEIASWIGTTRETASLQIEDFKRRGIISNRGRTLIVKDLVALDKVATLDTPENIPVNLQPL